MANYKRGRPRTASSGHNRDKWSTQDDRDWMKWGWLRRWPRWWDIVYHTRPQRRRTRECVVRVMQGDDPDAILWPVEKKPHIYYW